MPLPTDPTAAGADVLAGLVNLCEPRVQGAHDADFAIVDGKAYVVYMANDVQPGESPAWPYIYCTVTIVDLASLTVERHLRLAGGEQQYANVRLPAGSCFVPRVWRRDANTLRFIFSSEAPGLRQSQTWYRDFDLAGGAFADTIHRMYLANSLGVFPMQPRRLYEDAVVYGYRRPEVGFGLYPIAGCKPYDGRWHAVLNNFPGGHQAWAVLNEEGDCFSVLGHFFEPQDAKLTEAAVERLPDGTFLAISRQENNDRNYLFATSPDGVTWSPHEPRDWLTGGWSSKPTLDRFGERYYLGWQDAERIGDAHRTIFNLDVSTDGEHWQRRYRFETPDSFQYPTFHEHDGTIYLSVTQGSTSDSRKERIMFGRLGPA